MKFKSINAVCDHLITLYMYCHDVLPWHTAMMYCHEVLNAVLGPVPIIGKTCCAKYSELQNSFLISYALAVNTQIFDAIYFIKLIIKNHKELIYNILKLKIIQTDFMSTNYLSKNWIFYDFNSSDFTFIWFFIVSVLCVTI